MKRVVLLVAYVYIYVVAEAQTHGVVVDLQTGTPLVGVKIYTDANRVVTTGVGGRFDIPFSFRSATVTHSHYMKRTLFARELRDTVRLLPTDVGLHEVIIYGKKPQLNPMIMKSIKGAATSAPRKQAMVTFDFSKLFRRNRVSAKERERRRKAIENY